MDPKSKDLEPNKPKKITSGVVEVVGFFDKMDPMKAVNELIRGEYVLVEDYYHNGLSILKSLKKSLSSKNRGNSFQNQRDYREAYRDASHNLLLMVENHKLVVKKSPSIGWFEEFFPTEELFLISFPIVQGLNSSWQWYINGLEIKKLKLKIHPYYGVYFPTRFDHLELFDRWLENYDGEKKEAVDIGIGSGILSLQLLQHGFNHVIGTDINENAIIGMNKEKKRLNISNELKLYHGDLFANYDKKVELIVFNPPWLLAKHKLDDGIDQAIYYNKGLFSRFFKTAKHHLRPNGRIVIIFSNLSQLVKNNTRHPVIDEIEKGNRFKKENYLTQSVKSSSKKTNRKNWRNEEKVELWVLTHK